MGNRVHDTFDLVWSARSTLVAGLVVALALPAPTVLAQYPDDGLNPGANGMVSRHTIFLPPVLR